MKYILSIIFIFSFLLIYAQDIKIQGPKRKKVQQKIENKSSRKRAQSSNTHKLSDKQNYNLPSSIPSSKAEKHVIANPNSEVVDDDKIYDVVEHNAQFPGGDEACYNWLAEHIIYPVSCKEQGIQGRVFIGFIINKDGSIVDAKVIRSPDERLSAEALRVVKQMPKWNPARQDNKAVRSRFNLPIMFRLN